MTPSPHCSASVQAPANNPMVADAAASPSVLGHLCEPQVMPNEASLVSRLCYAIVLQAPWQWWICEAPYNPLRYASYGLKNLFEKAGFADLTVGPQAGFFTRWILNGNYFSSRFVRRPWPLQGLIKGALIPFWYLIEKLAPLLDKLHKKSALKAAVCNVTATKP